MPGVHPRNDVSPIFRKVTPIGYDYNNRDPVKFAATGFYYYHQWGVLEQEQQDDLPPTGPYLVTNKHVVLPNDSPDPDFLTIYTRNAPDVRRTTRQHIDLYDSSGEKLWRDHPENPDIDIVLIPLDLEIKSVGAFHRGDLLSDSQNITGGEMAQVVGYPELLPNFHKFPILRQALISSPFPVAYYDSPFFVIDAKLHDGMSGSPVIYSPGYLEVESTIEASKDWEGDEKQTVEIEGSTKRAHTKLLGVHSEERMGFGERVSLDDIREEILQTEASEPDHESYLEDLDQRITNIESETGVNRVWHAKYIDDIIRNV